MERERERERERGLEVEIRAFIIVMLKYLIYFSIFPPYFIHPLFYPSNQTDPYIFFLYSLMKKKNKHFLMRKKSQLNKQ